MTGSGALVAYLQHLDMLVVQLVTDPLPDGVRHRVLNLAEPGMQIAVTNNEDDALIYGLSFFQASKHLPKTVLVRSSELPIALGPVRGEPDMLHLPLQPGAEAADWVRAGLGPEERGVDLLLSRSRKVMGVLLARHRVPPTTAGRLPGPSA